MGSRRKRNIIISNEIFSKIFKCARKRNFVISKVFFLIKRNLNAKIFTLVANMLWLKWTEVFTRSGLFIESQ